MYTIAPLGSKQFLSFDLRDTLAEAGVKLSSMNQYFMHLTVSHCATSCLCCDSRVLTQGRADAVLAVRLPHKDGFYGECLFRRQPTRPKFSWGRGSGVLLAWVLRCYSMLIYATGLCRQHPPPPMSAREGCQPSHWARALQEPPT